MAANIVLMFGMNAQMIQKLSQFAEDIEDGTNLIFRNELANNSSVVGKLFIELLIVRQGADVKQKEI